MWSLIAMILSAAIIFLIGFQVWRLRPYSYQRRLFFFLSFIISSWMLCNYFSLKVTDKTLFLLFVRLVMIVTDWLPPTLLLFSYCFPNGVVTLSRRRLHLLMIWTVFITLLNFTDFVFPDARIVGDSWIPQAGWGIGFVLINMIGLLSLTAANFFRKSQNAAGLEKVRLTYFAFSFSLAMFFAVVFNLILPAFFQNPALMDIGIMAMGLTFVGTTGYTMLKTNFSSLDLIIATAIYYIVLLVWLIIPFALHHILPSNDHPSLVAATFFIYLLWLSAYVYIYNHLEKFLITKIVNHGADWNQESEKFFAHIQDELDLKEVLSQTLYFFQLLIKNTGTSIIGDFMDEGRLTVYGDIPSKATKLQTLARSLWQEDRTPYWIAEHCLTDERPAYKRLGQEMREFGIALIFPIYFYDDFKGVIVFGDKLGGNPYFVQDLDMITQTLRELSPLINKTAIHQNTKDFNAHLQRKIDRATARLRRMNEQLIAADKLKDEFVSVASHELRTPMTAIKGYLWMVAKNNTPEAIPTNQKYIEIALNSTERLIALVNDMLTISRIEGGRFALNKEIFDARSLLDQIRQELEPIAAGKNLRFVTKKPREKLMVNADAKRIIEVLHNLTGNALKFTKKGSVTLAARADAHTVYIDVIDTGVGIDEADFAKLFSKFARMEKSYVKIKETGTGLGLYISRQIMNMHGGDVTFVSRLDHGSTFTISLPRVNAK